MHLVGPQSSTVVQNLLHKHHFTPDMHRHCRGGECLPAPCTSADTTLTVRSQGTSCRNGLGVQLFLAQCTSLSSKEVRGQKGVILAGSAIPRTSLEPKAELVFAPGARKPQVKRLQRILRGSIFMKLYTKCQLMQHIRTWPLSSESFLQKTAKRRLLFVAHLIPRSPNIPHIAAVIGLPAVLQ